MIELMDKMARMIDETPLEQKKVLERWLSLANRRLHEEFEKTGDWGIIGGSMALELNFEKRFGTFRAQEEAIRNE